MPRSLSGEMASHIGQQSTTLATIVKITRADGVVLGFTTHDQSIEMDGVTYLSAPGLLPYELDQDAGASPGQANIEAVLSSGAITAADLANGLYDGADFRLGIVNWADISMGVIKIASGKLGRAERQGQVSFRAELRTLGAQIRRPVGRTTNPGCAWLLGDSRCGVDLAPFTFSGTVASVAGARVFTASGLDSAAAGLFAFGVLTWTSGPNLGAKADVQAHSVGPVTITLHDDMAAEIATGHQFTVHAGCNYTRQVCKDRFSNLQRFGGFPDMPGRDGVLKRI